MAVNVTGLVVENVKYSPSVKAPGSTKTLFLAGAGLRDGQRDGKYMKFSAVSVYLEDTALPWLAAKWKGKSAEELEKTNEFLKDVVNGPFEKLLYVTALAPLPGQRWAENQINYCQNLWKPLGVYTDSEAKALDKFLEIMKPVVFSPGHAAFLTLSPHGSFKVSFSFDGTIPEDAKDEVDNKLLTEEVLGGIIGIKGVSPATRKSVVERLTELINKE